MKARIADAGTRVASASSSLGRDAAAVLAFVQALDADYRKQGIRANAILPSVIDTPQNRRDQPDADFSTWVQPADIAKVVRHLVSEDAAVTSGGAIPVYGRA